MTKADCEKILLGLLETIRDVYHAYNPDGKYLTLAVTDHLSFNNAHWIGGADEAHPIDLTVFDDGTVRTTKNANGETVSIYYDGVEQYVG